MSEVERYRIEANCAMRDYDALELDAGIMLDALTQIAIGRRNQRFDPWARDLARETLSRLSEYATGLADSNQRNRP